LLTKYIKEFEKELQARATGQVPVGKYVFSIYFVSSLFAVAVNSFSFLFSSRNLLEMSGGLVGRLS